jgi:mRNA-degrading endonuclease toxin of MazEF toxin-antitoxin module
MYEQRDIVFMSVPFTDFSGFKERPVLIISDEDYHSNSPDAIICAITSSPRATEYSIFIDNPDMETGNLQRRSQVRSDKIIITKRSRFQRKFGKLEKKKAEEVIEVINNLIEIKE